MKFLNLNLQSYGPFTGKLLEFSRGREGVHLVYGPNEAGKSAALRALTSFLFGIPPRTTDNFLHDNSALRIRATLLHSDGSRKEFVRRKGNRDTLLDELENALDESELARFLAGVSLKTFETMYGLNTETLVNGGKDLVEGRGEIGMALFSAASGIPEIRTILNSIKDRADALFKPTASKPLINKLINEFNDLKKKCKESSLSIRQWEELTGKLAEFEEQNIHLKELINARKIEYQRKQRQAEVLNDAGELRELNRELLEASSAVILLPEDFSARRIETEKKLSADQLDADDYSGKLQEVNDKIQTLDVPGELLALQERITKLFQASGNYKQGQEQLPRLKGNVLEIERDCNRILRELKIYEETRDFGKYCLAVQDHKLIGQLCEEHNRINADLNHHEKTLGTYERRIEQLESRIEQLANRSGQRSEPKDVSILRRALSECRQSGLSDKRLKTLENEINILENETRDGLKRLGLPELNQEKLLSLIIPSRATINKFATDFQNIEQRKGKIERDRDDENKISAEIEDQIQVLRVESNLPTEEDLGSRREERNKIWRNIKDVWLDGQTCSEEAGSLATRYEQMVAQADEISDRLRHESERVANLAQLLTRRERSQKRLAEIEQEAGRLEADKTALHKKWKDTWNVLELEPGDPQAMREWRDAYEETLRRCKDWQQKLIPFQSEREEIKKLKTKLSTLIMALKGGEYLSGRESNETLESLCQEAEVLIKEQNDLSITIQQLKKQIQESREQAEEEKRNKAKCESNLTLWKANWAKAIDCAHLDADALPVQAKAVLEKFTELAGKVRDIEEKNSRIRAIESDGNRFRHNVEKLYTDLNRSIGELEHATVIEQLNRERTEGLKKQERLQNLNQKKEELAGSLTKKRASVQRNTAILNGLCELAGHCKPEELPAKEAQSADYRNKQARVRELKQIISRSAGGIDPEQFLSELNDVDADKLPSDIDDLEREINRLEKEHSELSEEIGKLKKEQELMESAEGAAEIAQQMELKLTEMREAVEEYSQSMLAVSAMTDAVECYRKENQGPVLQRATELFRRLTLENFEGLATDYDKDDHPILVGMRGGKKIKVEAMSDGTCDQLYLALRLASLEQRLNNSEPVPLILDDVLVNFDDRRAQETLKIFAELSRKTQIILFTHHRHIRELAEASLGADELFTLGL